MITINGEEWRILLVPPNHHSLYKSNGVLSIGVCDDVTKTICINDSLGDKLFKKVLCHELTHAAMFSYNVELTYDQEELLADIISTYGDEIIDITNQMFQKIKEGLL